MGQVHEQGLFSPALMQEIRQQFIYVDWDPYSDKRIYFDAASGSCRPKRIIEAMGMETCLPDQQGRDNPGSRHAVEVTAKGIEDLTRQSLLVGFNLAGIESTEGCAR